MNQRSLPQSSASESQQEQKQRKGGGKKGKNGIFLLNFCRMQVNKTPTESTEQYRTGIKGRVGINKAYPEALVEWKYSWFQKKPATEIIFTHCFGSGLWFTINRSVQGRSQPDQKTATIPGPYCLIITQTIPQSPKSLIKHWQALALLWYFLLRRKSTFAQLSS